MQLRINNLRGGSKLLLSLGLLFTLMVSPALAEQATNVPLTSIPAFMRTAAVVLAIKNAMAVDLVSPQDTWRARNLQLAIRMLPPALMGLADVFRSGQLQNGDLARVESTLGPMISVNAPDNIKKFLKHPSRDLIPSTGPGFPNVSAAPISGSGGPTGFTYASSGGSNAPIANPGAANSGGSRSPASTGSSAGSQLVNLASAQSTGFSYSQSPSGTDSSSASGFTYNNNGAGSTSGNSATGVSSGNATVLGSPDLGSGSSAGSADGETPAVQAAATDLTGVEASVGTDNTMVAPIGGGQPSDLQTTSARDNFFKSIGGDASSSSDGSDQSATVDENGKVTKKKKHRQDGASNQALPGNYRLADSPKYWSVQPLFHLAESLLIPSAHAEEGGGGGQEAAQILQTLAFMVMAIAPALAQVEIAQIQSRTDQNITAMNDQTQLDMTKITSDTSKYMANLQSNIALTQANIAQQINTQNQGSQTQRLQMQLSQLQAARQDALAAQYSKQAIQTEFDQERINLAQTQAADNVALAKQTLEMNLSAAGMSQGYANSPSTGGGLVATPAYQNANSGVASSTSLASAGGGSVGGPLGALGQATAGTGASLDAAGGQSAEQVRGDSSSNVSIANTSLKSSTALASNDTQPQAFSPVNAMAAKALIGSLSSTKAGSGFGWNSKATNGSTSTKTNSFGYLASNGATSRVQMPRGMAAYARSGVQSGSQKNGTRFVIQNKGTAGQQNVASSGGDDLTEYFASVRNRSAGIPHSEAMGGGTASFAQWRDNYSTAITDQSASGSSAHNAPSSQGSTGAAYNPPMSTGGMGMGSGMTMRSSARR